jgi:hypothetical protein
LRFANLSSSANLAASANLASSAWRASSAICAGEKFPDIFADAETGNGAVGVTNGTAEETNGTVGFFLQAEEGVEVAGVSGIALGFGWIRLLLKL